MQNLDRFYTTSDLIANISGKRQDIKNRKECDLERFLPRSAKQVR